MHDFSDDVVERATKFLTARVGDDAKRTITTTALHDRHVGTWSIYPGFGKAIEFLDLRKRRIDGRPLLIYYAIQHLRQPLQSLRAKHDIDIGCPLNDSLAFLARYATPHADDHTRSILFQGFPPAKL